jgi:hypothetical protein
MSALPYIIDIAKGKTHPNLVTWVTWTLVVCISTAAAISEGALHTAVLSGAIAIGDIFIVIMSVKRGVKKYTGFDIICQIIAFIGLALWLVTGSASLAVALSLVVVAIAALPTWRHAWIKPFEETWQGFAMGSLAGALTLASLTSFTFVDLAFPIVTVINCSLIVVIILSHRRLALEHLTAHKNH